MSFVQQRSLELILNAGISYEVSILDNTYNRIHNSLAQVRVARFHTSHIHDGGKPLVIPGVGGRFKLERKKYKISIYPRHQNGRDLNIRKIIYPPFAKLNINHSGNWGDN